MLLALNAAPKNYSNNVSKILITKPKWCQSWKPHTKHTMGFVVENSCHNFGFTKSVCPSESIDESLHLSRCRTVRCRIVSQALDACIWTKNFRVMTGSCVISRAAVEHDLAQSQTYFIQWGSLSCSTLKTSASPWLPTWLSSKLSSTPPRWDGLPFGSNQENLRRNIGHEFQDPNLLNKCASDVPRSPCTNSCPQHLCVEESCAEGVTILQLCKRVSHCSHCMLLERVWMTWKLQKWREGLHADYSQVWNVAKLQVSIWCGGHVLSMWVCCLTLSATCTSPQAPNDRGRGSLNMGLAWL